MLEDEGIPSFLKLSQEDRKAAWERNPPKAMPSGMKPLVVDAAVLQKLEEEKKIKTKNRIHKMLEKKEDHTGQRWDTSRSRWVSDEPKEPEMISITTNTRGNTKMTKAYADMSGPELVEAYNKISGKDPIKKFKDRATGLKRMTELEAAKPAKKELSDVVRKPKPGKAEGSENKLAAEFGARVGSFREKLLIVLDEHYKKQVVMDDLLKAVYGSKNNENVGALAMVIKGALTMIEKNKLPYVLKKEKNEAKEISYGLFPK